MTIRPRHYARLLVEGATPDQLAARIDALTALDQVRTLLAELMSLPTTHARVTSILADATIDELTRSVVTELGILGRLSWLSAILRSVEQLAATDGRAGVARVELAAPDVISNADLEPFLPPLIGAVSAVRRSTRPDQLGGITIQIADQRLDASLDRRLATLRSSLTKGC
jgi:F0F1-type ATP synthase delta subunit